MFALQRILGAGLVVAMAACGSGTGATGADAGTSDAGDSQIAPADVPDAAVATDAAPIQDSGAENDAPPTDGAPADVQPDSGLDAGDAYTPQNCMNGVGGGTGSCTNGLTCWTPPCTKCGVMPQGWCVPALQSGSCYDYTTCGGGSCYNATPMNGIAGWCLPAVKTPGQCWGNASSLIPDCVNGSSCDGQFVCPPNGACPMADKPGTCTANATQKGNVYLWERSGGVVSPGESVVVTWVNYTNASIFLPGCSTYSSQSSSDNTTWKDLGPGAQCVWEGVAVEVPAGGYVDTMAWQAPANSVGNYRLHGTYSVGCTPGKPISQAGCKGSADVNSDSFFVGMVP